MSKSIKKVYYILITLIVVLFISGCYEVKTRDASVVEDKTFIKCVGNITYVEFDGHQYVKYSNGYHGSICHSPNCPCLNTK